MTECPVCSHGEREKIELFLSQGCPPLVATDLWPPLEAWAFLRHRDEHMHGVAIVMNRDPMRVVHHIQDLVDMAVENVRLAKTEPLKKGEKRCLVVSQTLNSAIKAVETEARITQVEKYLDPNQLLPMWQKMQQKLLTALEPYPDARERVLEALAAKQEMH